MDLSAFKKLFIDGVELKQLFIAVLKNWTRYSTESDGVTIYNGGLGYKSGYRVRSAGVEGEKASSSCTGYIPVNPGDVIRVYGCKWGNTYESAFNAYSPISTHRGQIAGDKSNYDRFHTGYEWEDFGYETVIQNEDYYQWTTPTVKAGGVYISHIRVTGAVADGSKLVVYVNDDKVDTEVWKGVSYTNWIRYGEEATSSAIYNGKGWKENTWVNGGNEGYNWGTYVTGYIPCTPTSVMRLRNVTFNSSQTAGRMAFYDSNKKYIGQVLANSTWALDTEFKGQKDASGNYVQFNFISKSGTNANCSYIRITFTAAITDDSIITIDEEIE